MLPLSAFWGEPFDVRLTRRGAPLGGRSFAPSMGERRCRRCRDFHGKPRVQGGFYTLLGGGLHNMYILLYPTFIVVYSRKISKIYISLYIVNIS